MKRDIDEILNEWKVQDPTYNSNKLHRIYRNKILKKVSISIAACLLVFVGYMVYSNQTKPVNTDFLFEGSNSDVICCAAIMEE